MGMNIAGLQKVSTIDYPGEIAAVIFLHGCNFRCGFCYNPELVLGKFDKGYGEEEVLDFLRKRRGKLDAVCITGGEALVSLDFDFVRKVRGLGYKVKIDTNGSFPDRLKELIDLGLVDYVAMDIKSSRGSYCDVVGVDVDLKKIEESMKIVNDFGSGEFRTTVVERFHDECVMRDLGRWLNEVCGEKPRRIFLQGFRRNEEGMVDNSFLKESNVSDKYLVKMKRVLDKYFEDVVVRG